MKSGDKIVCIDDSFRNVSVDQLIRKDAVYTVRWVGNYNHYIDGSFYGVKLAEISRGADPADYGADDMPYRASRFRPVVAPKNERVLEDAL